MAIMFGVMVSSIALLPKVSVTLDKNPVVFLTDSDDLDLTYIGPLIANIGVHPILVIILSDSGAASGEYDYEVASSCITGGQNFGVACDGILNDTWPLPWQAGNGATVYRGFYSASLAAHRLGGEMSGAQFTVGSGVDPTTVCNKWNGQSDPYFVHTVYSHSAGSGHTSGTRYDATTRWQNLGGLQRPTVLHASFAARVGTDQHGNPLYECYLFPDGNSNARGAFSGGLLNGESYYVPAMADAIATEISTWASLSGYSTTTVTMYANVPSSILKGGTFYTVGDCAGYETSGPYGSEFDEQVHCMYGNGAQNATSILKNTLGYTSMTAYYDPVESNDFYVSSGCSCTGGTTESSTIISQVKADQLKTWEMDLLWGSVLYNNPSPGLPSSYNGHQLWGVAT
jgi:hypothetical protein